MAFQVRLTQTAKAEIDTAYSWLRERNPVYADKWFRELMNTISGFVGKYSDLIS